MAILRPGQRLGAYLIEGLLGQGGMAEVYRARHQTLERDVAIKVLSPAFNADPTFPLRFLREAKAVARLNHPNIVTVYDFGEEGELAYLVMELAPGGTFEDRAAALHTLSEAADSLAPVGDALQYAHERGIVHRDVKPINILINEESRPLLADFGLARVVSESLDVTMAEFIAGTPHYMAPEQALAGNVDHRADIYALGIVTYQVMAGQVPYDGPTVHAVIQKHLTAPLPSIRVLLPDAPPALDAVIQRAIAKRPEQRYSRVLDFIGELRQVADTAPDVPLRPSPRSTAASTVSGPATSGNRSASGSGNQPRLGVFCGQCGRRLAAADAFCRTCGTPRPVAVVSPAAPAVDLHGPTELAPFSDSAVAGPLNASPDGPPSPSAPPARPPLVAAAGEPSVARPRRRRATAFSSRQWLLISTAALLVIFINAVGLWLARAGRVAGEENLAAGLTTYIFDHLPAFKSALTALGLLLALIAAVVMRRLTVDQSQYAPETYRRLRQYHRLGGYAATIIAVAIGLLTCVGIFGFDVSSPRSALHSVLGTALLVLLVVKIGVVRYFPAQRRHLRLLGEGVLVLFALVFATSTVPYVWGRITGAESTYTNPYSSQSGEQSAESGGVARR